MLEQTNTEDGWIFKMEIGGINYEVSLTENYFEKLKGSEEGPRDFIRRSFEFLLEREPKEAILRNFDIKDINRYFPDFETEIKK